MVKPSPVPQVDGHIEQVESPPPIKHVYDGSQPWEKELLKLLKN